MVYLEIKAVILFNKMVEFNQTKIIFIDKLQEAEGYLGFTEKQGNVFKMKISWQTRKALNIFMKSEFYRVFNGAIITLSKENNTRIFKENKKQISINH